MLLKKEIVNKNGGGGRGAIKLLKIRKNNKNLLK
jgi:hypothetical protein